MGQDELVEAIAEAAEIIRAWSGASAESYFEGLHDGLEGPPAACHAVGLIQGAAIALGRTPIELLDEVANAEA